MPGARATASAPAPAHRLSPCCLRQCRPAPAEPCRPPDRDQSWAAPSSRRSCQTRSHRIDRPVAPPQIGSPPPSAPRGAPPVGRSIQSRRCSWFSRYRSASQFRGLQAFPESDRRCAAVAPTPAPATAVRRRSGPDASAMKWEACFFHPPWDHQGG